MSDTHDDLLTMAVRHVRSGRLIVERQRAIIRRGQKAGRNTEASEALLAQFERTQATFEEDLAWLQRNGGGRRSRLLILSRMSDRLIVRRAGRQQVHPCECAAHRIPA